MILLYINIISYIFQYSLLNIIFFIYVCVCITQVDLFIRLKNIINKESAMCK